MKYSDMSTNEQRLHIAAYGFQQVVVPDDSDVREAIRTGPNPSGTFGDPAKQTLALAVFIRAAKMANLKPKDILAWLARNLRGQDAIAEYAHNNLGMTKFGSRKAS